MFKQLSLDYFDNGEKSDDLNSGLSFFMISKLIYGCLFTMDMEIMSSSESTCQIVSVCSASKLCMQV